MTYQEALYTSKLEGEKSGELRGKKLGEQIGVQRERQETIEKLRKMGMSEEEINNFYKS